jgi:uncharacterized protein (TIGR02147 family)
MKSNNAPSIFHFTNYRDYLKAFFEFKKLTNAAYSASMFARKAGLGSNSRGYLKLVIENKRNLSAQTIRSFSEALGLNTQESLYFENLVLFNQSERDQDKKYYLERMMAANHSKKSEQLELMRSQQAYLSNWYCVAIRELVAHREFREDAQWIGKQLRGKVKKDQILKAIEDLLNLGLLTRNADGKIEQSETQVKITGGVFSAYIQNYHLQMLELAKDAVQNDEYDTRQASGVTLSCSIQRLPELKSEIAKFRDYISEKFGTEPLPIDTVFQMSLQLFQLTEPKKDPISK